MEFKGTVKGNCGTNDVVRTRTGGCDLEPGLIKTLLVTPTNATFPLDEEEFNTQLHANIVSGKITPIGGIVGAPVSGGDVSNASTDYGDNIPVGINPLSIVYRILKGGVCLQKELKKLDRKEVRLIWIDANGKRWGTVTKGKDGADVFAGFLGVVLTSHALPQNNTTPYMKYFNVAYDNSHDFEWANNAAFDSDVNIDGLMGVVLSKDTAGAVHIINACSGEDVGREIASMAEADALPQAFVTATGTNPATATIDADTGAVTLPAGSYRIASAVALDGLDIVGFDGINSTDAYVTVTTP